MARVLIVDDDEQARRFEASILETAGHEMLFARNGEEAMRAMMRKHLDLVVTDLHMSRGDGFELIEAISGLRPDLPIIAVSGTGPDQLDTAKMIGAHRTFEKPVSPTGLLQAVAELVAKA